MADNRRREKAIHEETWCIVNDLIVQDWSPEQISGWLAVEKNVRTSTSPATKSGKEACIFTYAAGKREKKLWRNLTGAVRSKKPGFDKQAALCC